MVGNPVMRGMSHGKREEVRRTKDPDRENKHLDIPAPWRYQATYMGPAKLVKTPQMRPGEAEIVFPDHSPEFLNHEHQENGG